MQYNGYEEITHEEALKTYPKGTTIEVGKNGIEKITKLTGYEIIYLVFLKNKTFFQTYADNQ